MFGGKSAGNSLTCGLKQVVREQATNAVKKSQNLT